MKKTQSGFTLIELMIVVAIIAIFFILTLQFNSLAQPLLILLMGGVVLIIVLAILLPIFDLNQLVK